MPGVRERALPDEPPGAGARRHGADVAAPARRAGKGARAQGRQRAQRPARQQAVVAAEAAVVLPQAAGGRRGAVVGERRADEDVRFEGRRDAEQRQREAGGRGGRAQEGARRDAAGDGAERCVG